jgi:hypothetical protein
MMRERGREKEKGERLDRLVPAVAVAAVVPAGTFPEQSRGRDQIQLANEYPLVRGFPV